MLTERVTEELNEVHVFPNWSFAVIVMLKGTFAVWLEMVENSKWSRVGGAPCTTRVTCVDLDKPPPDPFIVNVYVPVGVEVEVLIVNVDENVGVPDDGENE